MDTRLCKVVDTCICMHSLNDIHDKIIIGFITQCCVKNNTCVSWLCLLAVQVSQRALWVRRLCKEGRVGLWYYGTMVGMGRVRCVTDNTWDTAPKHTPIYPPTHTHTHAPHLATVSQNRAPGDTVMASTLNFPKHRKHPTSQAHVHTCTYIHTYIRTQRLTHYLSLTLYRQCTPAPHISLVVLVNKTSSSILGVWACSHQDPVQYYKWEWE